MSSLGDQPPPLQSTDPNKPWYQVPPPEVPEEIEEPRPITEAERQEWIRQGRENDRKAREALENFKPPKAVAAITGELEPETALAVVRVLHFHRINLMAAEVSGAPERLRARAMEQGEKDLKGLLPKLSKEERDQLLKPGLDLHY